MRGYALYSVRPDWCQDGNPASRMRVTELMAIDPAATRPSGPTC